MPLNASEDLAGNPNPNPRNLNLKTEFAVGGEKTFGYRLTSTLGPAAVQTPSGAEKKSRMARAR